MKALSPDGPWHLDPDVTFLNHGSFGSCPEPVLAAQRAWRDRMESEPIRFLWDDRDALIDGALATVGTFINADPEGLAFVPNVTTAVSTVLGSLRFEPGDELLSTDHEYNATLNAMAAAAARDGARLVIARIPFPIDRPSAATAAILDAVTSRTRLALISHVTSPTGMILPIDEIVGELDRRGIDTLVDAAHSPGLVPVDVTALGAAYWTGNGHKWLCGPKGSAFLHVRADRRDRIRPLVVSHGANDPRTDRSRFRLEFDWTGTGDPTPFLALADGIGIVGAFGAGGWPELMAANRALALEARDQVANALGVAPPAPEAMLAAMAALPVPALHSDADADRLHAALRDEDRIEVPLTGWPVRAARRHPDDPPEQVLLRVSAGRYNEPADYERLATALRRQLGAASGRGLSGGSFAGDVAE